MNDEPQNDERDDIKKDEPNLAEEYLAGWKRAMADYANLQKEMQKMQIEMAKYAGERTIKDILPVYENLAKATQMMPDSEVEKEQFIKWANGVIQVKVDFERILHMIGVSIIDQDGVPFDPNLHEALMEEECEGMVSGLVAKIIERGYKLHEKVLRPAKVVVSK